MSSIHNSKAPSRSSSNPAKVPPQSKKILIQQAPSLGSPGSSLATAGGTATINHPVQRPWPKAGSASPRPSRESSSQRMRHFRESRSPSRERRGPIAQQWGGEGAVTASEFRRQPPHPPRFAGPLPLSQGEREGQPSIGPFAAFQAAKPPARWLTWG